jgi:CubicO group peptidase (beta-lactamase class C family)
VTDELDPAGMARLHDAMATRVGTGELSGIVTVLARGDDVRIDEIGAVRRDTLFRITSFTKPVLATATMTLVEDGTIDLAEPVDRLLPELADRRVLVRIDGPLSETEPVRRPITVEDLLTFRMGFGMIVEPTFDPPYPIVEAANALELRLGPPDPRTPHPPDEWIARFGTLPLMYQPGERWQYNVAALVLGVLVARAGGGSLDEVLKARLFDPLGMADTGFWTAPENLDRLPENPFSPREQWGRPPVFASGAAGLLSTADDFLTFTRLLREHGVHDGKRILAPESVTALTTNHLTPGQVASAGVLLDPKGWGYGMAATPDRYGWDGGYGTAWFTDPTRDLIAIALTQSDTFLFGGARAQFVELAQALAASGPRP